ncbi:hypothetical protein [Sphingomonas sp. LT1P40]|uniref:hypothetical protein n=1 Tax=Alteristakelama amylovorans TaxID=3096166 RepID=UPI002FCA825B
MTAIPPSRYKVVERGRRLVVIDTHTGQPATRGHVPTAPRPEPSDRPIESVAPSRVDDRSGSNILTTARFYDLKGPREIVMTEEFSNRLGRAIGGWLIALFVFGTFATIFFPWLWIVPVFILLQPKARAATRQWITARLDQAAS